MSERSFIPNYNYNFNNNNYNNYNDYDIYNNYYFNERNFNPFINDLNNSFDSIDSNLYENKLDLVKDKNAFRDDILNQTIVPKENNFDNYGIKMDQSTTKFTDKLSGNKRNRCKENVSQKKKGQKTRKEKEVYIEINTINNENKNKMGRKKKDDINKGIHTKYSADNIIRKIKSNFFSFIHNLLNKSLKDKGMKFLKLNSKLNEGLKRDYNLDLLNRTIRDIYEKSKITSKLRKQAESNPNKNREIISKIYEENVEEQTIKILNLTYLELFKIFRSKIVSLDLELEIKKSEISLLNTEEFNDIHKFFEKIVNEEMKNNESQEKIDNYIKQIEELCIGYENWFFNKKGRERKKKEKKIDN